MNLQIDTRISWRKSSFIIYLYNGVDVCDIFFNLHYQYYVYFGGQKYVDLGLGSHRVKCRVHDEFR